MMIIIITPLYLAVKVSFRVVLKENNIKKLYIFNLFYLLDSCNWSLKWSLLGVKKRLGYAQIGLL